MNFLKANLVKVSGGYSVELLGVKLPLNDEQNAVLSNKGIGSQEIILGVRPEHTTVLFEKADNAIECTIDVNEMMGSELHLHLSSQNKDSIIVRLPTVDLTKEQRQQLSYGNKMYITFPAKVMHLFDPKSEKNLIAEQRHSLSYGNKMYITFPAKVMHLFDPETERSLIDG